MILDEGARVRAVREAGRSFAVEASAGTGKTRTLIDRIAHLVLVEGPDGVPLELRRICAITFTEKAAGEMRLRLRERFEQVSASGGPDGERAREALRDLDFANISTIHSLAVALLKERPVEAGLDPRFTAMDEATRGLLLEEVWSVWIRRELEARRRPLEAALREGLTAAQIRELALELVLHSNAVRTLSLKSPMTDVELKSTLDACAEELLDYRARSKGPDKLLDVLDDVLAWLRTPDWKVPPPKARGRGSAANWEGGRDTVKDLQQCIADIVDSARRWSLIPRQRVLDATLRWLIHDFLPEWEGRKRAAGLLDFDDQLVAARNLLRDSRSVRRAFLQRFRTLLVDEFQDTDDVQLHLALLLSSENLDETGLSRLVPAPGRLFIVGDPKQSIYRFRGADIESYLTVADPARAACLGMERLELTTNFRSVRPILSFVDAAFAGVMTRQGLHQPDYLAFGDASVRAPGSGSPPVRVVCERDSDGGLCGSGTGHAAAEAGDIARLILRMIENPEWAVQDSTGQWRVPEFGDIAVLMPVLTKADQLEREFQPHGIPYVLEGGRFYFARAEVSSALTALAAIDNPNDTVALYGTLHSVFFGLSDEDLVRARFEGVPLDYRAEVPVDSPLSAPFAILRELHAARNLRSPAETMERLLHGTGAREVLATQGFQPLANLGKLVRRLRAVQAGRTFSETLRLVRLLESDESAEGESRIMEERGNAVRVMSIHKAKGLDFRIVIVAGLGAEVASGRSRYLADPHTTGSFALSIGEAKGLCTPGWLELKQREAERASAELVRLLYVALTRARDHLVVSLRAKGYHGPEGWRFSKTRLEPLAAFFSRELRSPAGLFEWIPAGLEVLPAATPHEEASPAVSVAARYAAERADLERLVTSTPKSRPWKVPSDPVSSEDSDGVNGEGTAPRTRGVRLGSAFHSIMESVDLGDIEGAKRQVAETRVRFELDAESEGLLTSMLVTTMGSGLIARARAALRGGGRVLRELPYSRLAVDGQGGLEEGRIDLAFEESGGWVVVDYKTDLPAGTTSEFRADLLARYCGQLQDYAAVLHSAGIRVAEAYLLAARTGEAFRVIPA